MKKTNKLLTTAIVLAMIFSIIGLFSISASAEEGTDATCTHSVTAVAQVDATFDTEGTVAHYVCSACGKTFADEAFTTELTSVVAPKLNTTDYTTATTSGASTAPTVTTTFTLNNSAVAYSVSVASKNSIRVSSRYYSSYELDLLNSDDLEVTFDSSTGYVFNAKNQQTLTFLAAYGARLTVLGNVVINRDTNDWTHYNTFNVGTETEAGHITVNNVGAARGMRFDGGADMYIAKGSSLTIAGSNDYSLIAYSSSTSIVVDGTLTVAGKIRLEGAAVHDSNYAGGTEYGFYPSLFVRQGTVTIENGQLISNSVQVGSVRDGYKGTLTISQNYKGSNYATNAGRTENTITYEKADGAVRYAFANGVLNLNDKWTGGDLTGICLTTKYSGYALFDSRITVNTTGYVNLLGFWAYGNNGGDYRIAVSTDAKFNHGGSVLWRQGIAKKLLITYFDTVAIKIDGAFKEVRIATGYRYNGSTIQSFNTSTELTVDNGDGTKSLAAINPEWCSSYVTGSGSVAGYTWETLTKATCTNANGTTSTIYYKVLGDHTHNTTLVEGEEPDCEATGIEDYYTCSCYRYFRDEACQNEIAEPVVIPENGHTTVIDEAVAPTCTETGLTEGSHCSVCSTVFVAQETVDALGHSFKDDTLCERCGLVVVAWIGDIFYETLPEAFSAAVNGDEVVITAAGTYKLGVSGKSITVTGATEDVVFEGMGAYNMGSASVTFNNVTFNWTNANYKGLQHAGDLVYNNCTINGQVFLYGTSEIFKECTFKQISNEAYNVWTYGAKYVEFNKCTFNSAGKSVLVYTEDKNHTYDIDITATTFNASAAVEGKAAIEIDTSISAGANITIDEATTATGFGTGNASGNSLWNNKKGNATEANNDVTISVGNEEVLAPLPCEAEIGGVKYTGLQTAINAAANGATVSLIGNLELAAGIVVDGKSITLDLEGYILNYGITTYSLRSTPVMITVTGNATLTIDGEGTLLTNGAVFSIEEGSNVVIHSGTFDVDVTDYLADGLRVLEVPKGENVVHYGVVGNSDAPHIKDGYWYVGDYNTGIVAQPKVEIVEVDGVYYWSINGVVTDMIANPTDGNNPTIDIVDGYWAIDMNDGNGYVSTDVLAAGVDGIDIVKIEKTGSDSNVDTYTITYSNDTTSQFYITNGLNGNQGLQGETGPQGEKGPQGDRGEPGVNGNSNEWIVNNAITIAVVCALITVCVVLGLNHKRLTWWS